jgi:Amt family ammonium transporter
MLGTLTLWFGWYGFNAGSALTTDSLHRDQLTALAAVNTTLAGGMAGLVSLFLNYLQLERATGEPVFDLIRLMNGSLAGLVAITSGCGVVEPWAAVVIGGFAGALYLKGSLWLVKMRLDDAVDAIPVHMFNGIFGMIAVGLFASPNKLELTYGTAKAHVGWFYSWGSGSGDAHLLGAQVVGILFILGWVFSIMLPFFIWLDWKGWFRSDPLEEIVGLDTSYHGGLILASGDEQVNPEYISQFQNKREQLRRRRQSASNHGAVTIPPEVTKVELEEDREL